MAGHHKWSKSSASLAPLDQRRGKFPSMKFEKEITIATKVVGCAPTGNPHLRVTLGKGTKSPLISASIRGTAKLSWPAKRSMKNEC
jgi:transcriptional/translational regulatory protein YebC/TACO1